MKQIFGNYSIFAVCYELEQDYSGTRLFGNFCYWIADVQIGNYELVSSLSDLLWDLRTIVRDNGDRDDLSLFNLPANILFERLYNAIYGENSEYEDIATEDCWARFRVDFVSEIFSNWKVYLIEQPPTSRIIYSHFEESIVEIQLPSGVFDRAITDAFNNLFDIYEAEVKKS